MRKVGKGPYEYSMHVSYRRKEETDKRGRKESLDVVWERSCLFRAADHRNILLESRSCLIDQ